MIHLWITERNNAKQSIYRLFWGVEVCPILGVVEVCPRSTSTISLSDGLFFAADWFVSVLINFFGIVSINDTPLNNGTE